MTIFLLDFFLDFLINFTLFYRPLLYHLFFMVKLFSYFPLTKFLYITLFTLFLTKFQFILNVTNLFL